MNTSHFPQDPNLQEPGSPQNPVQETNPVPETAVEATPTAAVPQAIVPESVAPEAVNPEPAAPEAVVPASVAPQLPVTPQAAPAAGARPAIEIRGLTKAFGQKVAVDRINLDIPSGSFYGLVGRNGAGKTTTISMVTGMLMPSEGTAYVRGIDMWTDPLKAKAHLGVLPDGVHLFDKLTGEQLITYSGYLHGIDKETVASRVKDLLAAMDLTDAAGR
ncbi:ATP-binding cassette domain-containing protein, partial [Rothia mucilaginosa]